MKPIGRALLELRAVMFSTGLFNSLIDSMVVFLLSLLVFLLFGIHWSWSFLPFGIFFIWNTRRKLRKLGYFNVEKKVPELKEALRTAADTVNKENEIVNALHKEVIEKMKLIKTSQFIGLGRFTRQLILIALLSFLIIAISALDIQFFDASATFGGFDTGLFGAKDGIFAKIGGDGKIKLEIDGQEITILDETELYGNASLIQLGTQQLNLELNPFMSGVKIGDVRDAEKRDFKDQTSPTEIQASSDKTFTEDIPKEYKTIVRTYFRAIPK